MPRRDVKDKRRQQLMEANIASIAKRGFAETTIAHVSKGAGMSRGIVNFYFTSKENMMQDTLRFLTEEYTRIWQQALLTKQEETPEVSAEELLHTLIDANFDASVCAPKRLNIWSAFWGHASTHKAYGKIIEACEAQHINKIAELWESICEAKNAKRREQSTVPQQLNSLIRGMWLMLLVSPEASDVKSLLSMCQRALQEKIETLTGNSRERPVPAAPPAVKPEKPEKKALEIAAKPKPKKPDSAEEEARKRQLDFADLFGGKS